MKNRWTKLALLAAGLGLVYLLPAGTEKAGPSSLLAPLTAISIAILFRKVIPALLAGALVGCLAIARFDPQVAAKDFFATHIGGVVSDDFKITIVVFIMALIGMIGIISRGGGTAGLVDLFTRRATSRRRVRLTTALMGLAVFFDDYSNTVIVGNTMRQITDRVRIAREKLAYIVDSTAAPVAGLAVVSTWIGYEISLYEGYVPPGEAYAFFLKTLPFRFYSLFTLAFVLLNAALSRDYGPMLTAERRAAREGKVVRDGADVPISEPFDRIRAKKDAPHRWYNAAIPVGTVVALILLGQWVAGGGYAEFAKHGWAALAPSQLIGHFGHKEYGGHILAGAALIGSVVAAGILWAQRILSLKESLLVWISGLRSFVLVITILILAWTMASVCDKAGTGLYLSHALGEPPVWLIPAVIFGIGAVVSFSTGTSWGTMAILMPTTLPFVAGFDNPLLLVVSLGAVLEGSIFGDHCSPISDTTVLSSISSGCDHLDHVRTQMPYALTTAAAALVCGYIPAMLGLHWIGCLALGGAGLLATLLLAGRQTES